MKWVGLILMILSALVYWVSKINDLEPVITNICIASLALGAIVMAAGVFISKGDK
ncbi:hypothetical protein [Halobacillus sp. Marseille-P3879]|uniref:hypothetical protein n=1 Tax=Halobacillus sp. Marseille-P3879 TaxID=2045014 RepID=UPI001358BBA5|nr:hypothetical protein [Halobacillus sp. Marseille-P3879]